jgi:hypothetical protein
MGIFMEASYNFMGLLLESMNPISNGCCACFVPKKFHKDGSC